jgi:hypothetical protein
MTRQANGADMDTPRGSQLELFAVPTAELRHVRCADCLHFVESASVPFRRSAGGCGKFRKFVSKDRARYCGAYAKVIAWAIH